MSPFLLLLLLAVLQGLTEYLPVSSSGHLVLARLLLPGGSELPQDASVEVLLHLGTLAAVLVFYKKELQRVVLGLFGKGEDPAAQRKLCGMLLLATLPAAFVGLVFKEQIETTFASTQVAAICLMITSMFLWLSRGRGGQKTLLHVGVFAALLIGLAQAFAILPGISRSGSTIVVALFLGYRAEAAAAFSFLLSIPAISGAALLKLPDALSSEVGLPDGIWFSAILTFLVGLLALGLLLRIAQSGRLSWFAPYCLLTGIIAFFLA
ncbi:MAG: undecaprenyl-diphosphate phosphatase [Planctomycetota bacterium]|jgi:undecaprenyl-diphosphatase|nr:undecaprenyl-diphosphate phosphatase [Planctomycetota bacterium]MDP6941709.1 undecaprenyl-diphosphate phosphatase [Planctomycetota bacterium]